MLFLIKIKMEKKYLFKKMVNTYIKKNRNLCYVLIVFNRQMYFNRQPVVSGVFWLEILELRWHC